MIPALERSLMLMKDLKEQPSSKYVLCAAGFFISCDNVTIDDTNVMAWRKDKIVFRIAVKQPWWCVERSLFEIETYQENYKRNLRLSKKLEDFQKQAKQEAGLPLMETDPLVHGATTLMASDAEVGAYL